MAEESDNVPHFINANGQKIFCKYWEPETEIRALALIIHGLGEHILRYERIAKMLTDLGFKVFGHDHIGHGQSEGTRIDVEEFSFYSRDCLQHVDMMKERHPNLPIFAVSHSMGGLINVMMANERPKDFINLLISPALGLNPRDATPFKIATAKVASWCWYNKELPKVNSATLSRDPAVCKDYDEDPLVFHGGIKVGFLVKMYNSIQASMAAAPLVEWPYLLLHGDKDDLCYVGSSKRFHELSKSENKSLKIYKGYFHELDKEPEEYSKVVFDDMREWLTSQLNGLRKDDDGNEDAAAGTKEDDTAADTKEEDGDDTAAGTKEEVDESDVKVEDQTKQEE